jgi:UDP-galactopyranose mutase
MYDYLIVGAGLFGTTFARLATDAGKTCLVIDSRNHIAGNCYTEKREGIEVHVYGPHIFHTNSEKIWNFVNRFTEFNNFVLSPKAYHGGKMYSLPFNMNTFYEMWGTLTPDEAKAKIEEQRLKLDREPANLEEQALSLVGTDIYNTLIKEYTEKQWKTSATNLPADIIKRLPVRFTYDNNYFNDRYQGIPVNGYTKMFERMLDGIPVKLDTNYFGQKNYYDSIAKKVVFTGKIDEYFDYEFGVLDYRTLDFVTTTINKDNHQGAAIVNYNDSKYPWTRVVEHKHFNNDKSDVTIVTEEIPTEWDKTKTPYYPINNDRNMAIFNAYRDKADTLENVIFGGRLAEYRYYDMHQVIGSAMAMFEKR